MLRVIEIELELEKEAEYLIQVLESDNYLEDDETINALDKTVFKIKQLRKEKKDLYIERGEK